LKGDADLQVEIIQIEEEQVAASTENLTQPAVASPLPNTPTTDELEKNKPDHDLNKPKELLEVLKSEKALKLAICKINKLYFKKYRI
jgi:hypothetical protein